MPRPHPVTERPSPRRVLRHPLLLGFSFLAVIAATAAVTAHTDPPGSTATGSNISLTAFRSDGITPVLPGTVSQCSETIIYRGTLAWAGGSNAAIQGGTLTITTPDGVPHDVTPIGGIPCLGGTDGAICTPGVTSINSQTVSYTVDPSTPCSSGSTLTASISWTGGTAHLGAGDLGGQSASVPLQLGLECCTPTATPVPPTSTVTPTVTPTPTRTFPASITPPQVPTPPRPPTNTPKPTKTPKH